MIRWLRRLLTSSLGRKYVMAASGLLLVLFLIAHLAGNATLFISDEAFNGYAATLESYPLLPLAEAGLFALFAVHVAFALVLIVANRRARRARYSASLGAGAKTLASSTMAVTGPVVLVFLIVHLVDFRVPKLFAEHEYDLARAVRARLSAPLGATIYFAGLAALGLHLWHGFQSAFQTVGLAHPRWKLVVVWIGRALAVGLFAGFAAFPFWLFALRG